MDELEEWEKKEGRSMGRYKDGDCCRKFIYEIEAAGKNGNEPSWSSPQFDFLSAIARARRFSSYHSVQSWRVTAYGNSFSRNSGDLPLVDPIGILTAEGPFTRFCLKWTVSTLFV